MIAENLVKKFFCFYFNPRRDDWNELNLKVNTYPWYIKVDRPIYNYFDSIELHLTMKYEKKERYISIADIRNIFFKELNNYNLNIEVGIYNIINSFLLIFYFPLSYINDNKSIVINKAISLFQLSRNYPQLNKNDKVRNSYVKFLFYNTHLYEELKFLKINKGRLYYKNQFLLNYFIEMLRIKNHSFLFSNVVNYCMSFIDFLENGFQEDDLKIITGINDIYLDCMYYNFFIEKGSPYKYKRMVEILFEMQSYPDCGNIDFFNKVFIFNFTNLLKEPENYVQKYLNRECAYFVEVNKKLSDLRWSNYFKM